MTNLSLIQTAADSVDIDPQTLGRFIVSPDVSNLDEGRLASVLVALHHKYGLDPMSRAFIVFDKKVYPTAAAVSAVKRLESLGVEVYELGPHEMAGLKLLRAVAECGRVDVIAERKQARARGETELPHEEKVETCTTFVPAQIERVTEWKKNASGKNFPGKKEWRDPDPAEFANMLMKLHTKAERRVILKTCGMGTAHEDHPDHGRQATDELVEADPIVEAEFVERPPRKDAALVRSNEERRDLYAHLVGKEPNEIWAGILGRLEIEGWLEPHQLPAEDLLGARAILKPAIIKVIGERAFEGLEGAAKAHEIPVLAALLSAIGSATDSAVPWSQLAEAQKSAVIELLGPSA